MPCECASSSSRTVQEGEQLRRSAVGLTLALAGAEHLRIGIVADIAAIASLTKQTAAPTADANASGGADALFAVLLQQLSQVAQPTVDPNQLVAQNDNSAVPAKTQSSAAQDMAVASPSDTSSVSEMNLFALLQNGGPNAPVANGLPKTKPAVKGDQKDSSAAPSQPDGSKPADLPPDLSSALQQQETAAVAVPQPPQMQSAPATKDADTQIANVAAQQQVQVPPDPTDNGTDVQNANAAAAIAAVNVAAPADGNLSTNANSANTQDVETKIASGAPAIAAPTAGNLPANAGSANTQDAGTKIASNAPAIAVAGAAIAPTSPVTKDVKTASGAKEAKPTTVSKDSGPASASPTANGTRNIMGDSNLVQAHQDPSRSDAPARDLSNQSSVSVSLPSAQISQASVELAPPAPRTPDASANAAAIQAPATVSASASSGVNLQVVPQHHDESTSASLDTLGVSIAAKSADGIKHFDIRMDPPELGRVEVRLSFGDDGKTQASLIVEKPQTLELLQRDAASLHRTLSSAGLDLSNNGLNFSLRGQDRQNDGGSVAKGRSRPLTVQAVVNTDTFSNSGSTMSLAPGDVRVDIRV